jgi:hypothetical protein
MSSSKSNHQLIGMRQAIGLLRGSLAALIQLNQGATMKRLSILGVMLTGILAVAAMGATSAMASAELPEFLQNLPDVFSGSGTGGKLRTLTKEIVECEKFKIEGEVKGASKGEIKHLDFTGCKALGFQSNSLGDTAGTMLADNIPFETCYIKEGTGEALEAGLYLDKIKVHLEVTVTGQLINIEGSLIGRITPLNTAGTKFTIAFTEKAEGDPFASECKLGTNTLKASLTSNSDTKHEKASVSGLTQKIELTFLKEHELDG